ncbi:Ff.00g078860.m01.CDS01 [Fusarium sp. VM40]|nr:Ff.00g078860.m01.CDS01 [Fusarium sp. VM40]
MEQTNTSTGLHSPTASAEADLSNVIDRLGHANEMLALYRAKEQQLLQEISMQEVQHKDELTQANEYIEELKRDVRACKDTCRRLVQEQTETESDSFQTLINRTDQILKQIRERMLRDKFMSATELKQLITSVGLRKPDWLNNNTS